MSTDSEEAGYYAMSDASSSESCPDDEGDDSQCKLAWLVVRAPSTTSATASSDPLSGRAESVDVQDSKQASSKTLCVCQI